MKKRGRKQNPNGKILSNGLYEKQWLRIQKEAKKQALESAIVLRQIVDWYFTAKDMQESKYAHVAEFEKLSIDKPV